MVTITAPYCQQRDLSLTCQPKNLDVDMTATGLLTLRLGDYFYPKSKLSETATLLMQNDTVEFTVVKVTGLIV